MRRCRTKVEWFRNIRNVSAKRAYENANKDFLLFTGIKRPEEFHLVTRAYVIAWREALGERIPKMAGHGGDHTGASFRPLRNSRGSRGKAITLDRVYKLVRKNSTALGFEIGAHALRATVMRLAIGIAAERRVVNELPYSDETSQEQFLRRTLFAGAHNFNQRFSQTLPQKVLDIFRSDVNYAQRLYIVGYSFGDAHIDLVIRNWLEFSGERSIVIVDPSRQSVPPQFAHLALQIEIRPQTASQFFAGYREEPMTHLQKSQQELRAASRSEFEKKLRRSGRRHSLASS